MGATTEFMTPAEIGTTFANGRVEDIVGGGPFGWQPGEVTDDTQMSFCIMRAVMVAEADGIIDREKFKRAVIEEFIKWYDSGPKDVGNACAIGILALKEGKVANSSQALGNGGLMRSLPLALIGEAELNAMQNNLTHSNSVCRKALWLYQRVVYHYLEHGASHAGPDNVPYGMLMQPTGCVVNTLNNALYYVYASSTIQDAILQPVNAGGDSDTIACITGGMAGAKWGVRNIPQKWIRQLLPEVRARLDEYSQWACGYLERKAARVVQDGPIRSLGE